MPQATGVHELVCPLGAVSKIQRRAGCGCALPRGRVGSGVGRVRAAHSHGLTHTQCVVSPSACSELFARAAVAGAGRVGGAEVAGVATGVPNAPDMPAHEPTLRRHTGCAPAEHRMAGRSFAWRLPREGRVSRRNRGRTGGHGPRSIALLGSLTSEPYFELTDDRGRSTGGQLEQKLTV